MKAEITKLSPFLRWVGGKTRFLKHLSIIIKNFRFNNYFEPFLGGGAVFFFLRPKKRAFLSDINSDLIDTYMEVKKNPKAVIDLLMNYENTEEFYYFLRSRNPSNTVEKAARFIYLNQTSYNGLYRVNKMGKYNVPYGFRKNLKIHPERIIAASNALKNATWIGNPLDRLY
jgi:DNA adenine methylase